MTHVDVDELEKYLTGKKVLWPLEFCSFVLDQLPAIIDEVRSLREITAKLPVTADGVPITPGMTIYPLHPIEDEFDSEDDYATVTLHIIDGMSGEELDEGEWLPDKIYSSKAAAQAARKDQKDAE